MIFEGIKGRKGTKKPVFFLRHRHKDHAWKLYMGTHSRFKSENDLTYSVLFTNYSIQKFNCGSIYCNESVSVNRGISVLRSSLKGVFLIFTSLSSCFLKENTPLVRLYANQRSNSSVCFGLCEVNVIWNNALDACFLIYRKIVLGSAFLSRITLVFWKPVTFILVEFNSVLV